MTLELPDPLHYDEAGCVYTGELDIAGVTVKVVLELDGKGSPDPARRRAQEVLADFAAYHRRAQEYAVQKLLPVKNARWLAAAEAPLTAEQFQQRMTLHTLTFFAGGDGFFYYDAGEMFGENIIELTLDAGGDFVFADIPG